MGATATGLKFPASATSVSTAAGPRRSLPSDPRLFQIIFLAIILGAGAWLRDLGIRPAQILLTFAAAPLFQRLVAGNRTPPLSSYRSPLITALSLSLLLRADNLWAHPAAAALAIGSKHALRVRGKHLFNPSCFGVICALVCLPGTWVSAGQWGADVATAGWIVGLGAIVVTRARRAEISWSFLTFYLGGLALRMTWLGQSSAVWLHQLSSGALLLFAFFMISDPMTIPNEWRGRIAHAALVAAIAYAWGFWLYRTNGLLWALMIAAPIVPLWDWLWPAPKYQWT